MTKANYDDAVRTIKNAILKSQYRAAKAVNQEQLSLYFGIGRYISEHSRAGFWGTGAIERISEQLQKELPGLRGFSGTSIKKMRQFYEEWCVLFRPPTAAELPENSTNRPPAAVVLEFVDDSSLLQLNCPPSSDELNMDEFMGLSFSHHIEILNKTNNLRERLFYIHEAFCNHWDKYRLRNMLKSDLFRHQGALPNNFMQALPAAGQALRAIGAFKDEYLLDFINVEELNARDAQDTDERLVENAIIHNIKNFILTFGKGFAFIRNQYHLDAFGEDQYIDLLFFNRELNCLVAVELKTGKFKTAYLGQLQGYLSILDGFERRPHENPSIGIILCKDMNKSFVDYIIRDYSRPMGVATYKTSKDMSDELRNALPDIEALRKVLDGNGTE